MERTDDRATRPELEALSRAVSAPEPTLLIIADISGYTRYMTANAKTLAHSQTIITELVMAIVKEVELPLQLAKLEGDAVFLYCRKQHGDLPWPEAKRLIGQKLLTFFRLFGERVAELSQSTTCTCNACRHIERLRLKVIVHSGEVLFHHVFHLLELAGVDVIVAHRLLKNSVSADQYLLLTEAAHQDVDLPAQVQLTKSNEDIEDIGRIQTYLFFPEHGSSPASIGSFAERFRASWGLFRKMWFKPLQAGANEPKFQHVASSSSAAGRIAFAILTAVLTPLFLVVGALTSLVHARKQGSAH